MKNNEYIEISRDIENLLKSESTHTFLILIDILLRSNNETNSLKTSISKIEMDGKSDGQSKLTVLTALALRSGNLVEITLTGQILAVRYLTARSHLQKLHRRELQTASRNTLSMLSLLIS